ncbi:MAG: hypothetical protein HQ456_01190 [Polynucleobacter sp.]|nr:hypothetical protein [Polynucleobacter sp.]
MTVLLGETKMLLISDLLLDPENPRIPDTKKGADQTELAITLDMGFDAFTVAELMAVHGYFASEPMIAIPGDNGKWIVVEGNRRLTAVLGLTNPDVRSQFLDVKKWDELAARSKISASDKIPVVIAKSRLDVVPIIGTRHINGILAWKPYPQARYIANLIDVEKISAADVSIMIGLSKNTVNDLYREQAIAAQAKSIGIDTGNVESAFSLLTVAMRNAKLREHVGAPISSQLPPGSPPIPEDKIPELKETLIWIFGSEGQEPRISDSRQITSLANVVANPAGLQALRDGKSLDEAKQKIVVGGQSPQERLINRLTAGKNALIAAGEDIAVFNGENAVKTLIDEIESALETLKSVVEDSDA